MRATTTIDATTEAELQLCLRAASDGFATEGVCLQLPEPTDQVSLTGLGPRLTADVARLRQLVCPASAAAFMLALATDADASCLNSCLRHFVEPDASQVRTLGGDYRVPPLARPLLRAALNYHQDCGAASWSGVLAAPRATPPGPSAMLHCGTTGK